MEHIVAGHHNSISYNIANQYALQKQALMVFSQNVRHIHRLDRQPNISFTVFLQNVNWVEM